MSCGPSFGREEIEGTVMEMCDVCVLVYMRNGHSFRNVIFMCHNNVNDVCQCIRYSFPPFFHLSSTSPPQSVDDLPVVSDKGGTWCKECSKNSSVELIPD